MRLNWPQLSVYHSPEMCVSEGDETVSLLRSLVFAGASWVGIMQSCVTRPPALFPDTRPCNRTPGPYPIWPRRRRPGQAGSHFSGHDDESSPLGSTSC